LSSCMPKRPLPAARHPVGAGPRMGSAGGRLSRRTGGRCWPPAEARSAVV